MPKLSRFWMYFPIPVAGDTASLGSILIPMMVDQGYDDDFSTAVTITSSCEGLLVPPSHNMVIYAMSAGIICIGITGLLVYYNIQKKIDRIPEYVFLYAENQPENYPTTLGARYFADLVEERTGRNVPKAGCNKGEEKQRFQEAMASIYAGYSGESGEILQKILELGMDG